MLLPSPDNPLPQERISSLCQPEKRVFFEPLAVPPGTRLNENAAIELAIVAIAYSTAG